MAKRLTATHAEFDNNGNLLAIGEKKLAQPWKHSVTEIILNIQKEKCVYYIKGKGSFDRSILKIKNNVLYTDSKKDNIQNLLLF